MAQLGPTHRPLPRGYRIGIYEFERVLGTPGAFGITYAARNLRSGDWVAIKELFPIDHVVRRGSDRVVPQSPAEAKIFASAMEMFQREAQILGEIKHENVVRVLDYIEANNTGYMIMVYEHGFDLRRYLESQKPGRLNENELRNLLMPLLDGLEAVHAHDYLHRDIKPSNIYFTRNYKPVLLDFGAARQLVVSSTRPLTHILTPPYAPIEQWGQELPLGPYTDIYAMGVVLFKAMLADQPFPDAPDRFGHDPFVPLAQRLRGQEYSDKFLSAVDWALHFRAQDRPQTVAEWRKAFSRTNIPRRNRSGRDTTAKRPGPKPRATNFWKAVVIIIVGTTLLAALIAWGLWALSH
jgi:serine/threonine protein kinase